MTDIARESLLQSAIERACERIAPAWPLDSAVAVNPYLGFTALPHDAADRAIAETIGGGLYPERSAQRAAFEAGAFTYDDVCAAAQELGLEPPSRESLTRALASEPPARARRWRRFTEVIDARLGTRWDAFVLDKLSRFVAAYYDDAQALAPLPGRENGLFAAWRAATAADLEPRLAGLGAIDRHVREVPETAAGAIAWSVGELGCHNVEADALTAALYCRLAHLQGWASWLRHRQWRARLAGGDDTAIGDLLAMRMAYDALAKRVCDAPEVLADWERLRRDALDAAPGDSAERDIDRILLLARERAYQRRTLAPLARPASEVATARFRPGLQAVFCIDVRSEHIRHALERVRPDAQTFGFAGFFGVFAEFQPLGAARTHSHVPAIVGPSCCAVERCDDTGHEHPEQQTQALARRRRERLGLRRRWKHFKQSAASAYTLIETTGLLHAPKLVASSLGWTRPVEPPAQAGLSAREAQSLRPVLADTNPDLSQDALAVATRGLTDAERVDLAERILRATSLKPPFAPIVLLVGHAANTVNNPHAAALECGACGGQSGEVSARVAADLLNTATVREGLAARGLVIPSDTCFIGAVHDTTTDDVRVYLDDVPAAVRCSSGDEARLRESLMRASMAARARRAPTLGLPAEDPLPQRDRLVARAHDWAQVRPEWGLVNNAAFIAARRARIRHADFGGRAFLHEYDAEADRDGAILELVMTAPMVVAHWINQQYYASRVDPQRFGAGDKTLHNVVGGTIGVLEGAGGDLRIGLARQSLHDGRDWRHEPLRLSVLIEAPATMIDGVLARHDGVHDLVRNGWLHLFRLDADGRIERRRPEGGWVVFAQPGDAASEATSLAEAA